MKKLSEPDPDFCKGAETPESNDDSLHHISVLLVTTIFSAADMIIRGETVTMQAKHGNWHIQVNNISDEIAEEISNRPDVTAVGWSAVFNEDADQPYTIGERKATLYGTDETYLAQLADGMEEGAFPQSDQEVVLSSNAKLALDVQLGDSVTVQTPAGNVDLTISGFGSDDQEYYEGQTYLVAVYMTKDAFVSLMNENGVSDYAPACYMQFQSAAKAADAIAEIQTQYSLPEGSIRENTAIMGLAGQSSNESMQNVYGLAAILFIMVLLAGVLMISGSMNSQVAQRTKFFGMMRCIGMSKQQIIRFVRLEALNWCKTAVPIGLVLGILVSWVLCAALRFFVGEEFSNIPLFGISGIGIVSGILVGVITVLLAARTPAKHAARVSPVAAVSGNSEKAKAGHHAVHTVFLRIETALGIHHAVAAKKNLFLMTGSFALSIILFLSFSVLIDFVDHLMPQSAATSDIDISSSDGGNSIDSDLVQTLSAMEGVKQVYGRRSSFDVAAGLDGDTTLSSTLDLVSFDDFDLKALQKDGTLRWGSDLSEVYGDSEYVLATWDQNTPWAVGDTILIGDEQITIAGLLKYDPFSGDGLTGGKITLITSDETFIRLTGITDYSLIMIQTTSDATDEDVAAIRQIVEESGYTMNDKRDERTSGTYFAFVACVYAFLGIITLVTVLNIVNSISMSVSARIRQYGSMRAVGMDGRQLSKMILAEAFTYAFWGCIIGCAVGLPFSKVIYDFLITDHFPYASWSLPIGSLAVIVLFVIAAAVLAAYSPAKRMRTISVTETINEL